MTSEDLQGPVGTTTVTDDRSKPAEVAQEAKAAASDVASTATSSAKEVASEAVTQARVVADEARHQVSTVVDQTRQELSRQADDRARQAAGGLRTLADQVTALTEGRPGDAGPLAGYLDDARSRVSSFAERLETAGPQGLLDDVSDFARRRPLVFLGLAVGAGFMVGRVARAGRAVQQEDGSPEPMPMQAFPQPVLDAPLAAPTFDAPIVTTSDLTP